MFWLWAYRDDMFTSLDVSVGGSYLGLTIRNPQKREVKIKTVHRESTFAAENGLLRLEWTVSVVRFVFRKKTITRRWIIPYYVDKRELARSKAAFSNSGNEMLSSFTQSPYCNAKKNKIDGTRGMQNTRRIWNIKHEKRWCLKLIFW